MDIYEENFFPQFFRNFMINLISRCKDYDFSIPGLGSRCAISVLMINLNIKFHQIAIPLKQFLCYEQAYMMRFSDSKLKGLFQSLWSSYFYERVC